MTLGPICSISVIICSGAGRAELQRGEGWHSSGRGRLAVLPPALLGCEVTPSPVSLKLHATRGGDADVGSCPPLPLTGLEGTQGGITEREKGEGQT